MSTRIVVEEPGDWPAGADGVVIARHYLTGPSSGERATRIFNLCRSFGYQSPGYYVSLLAEARGEQAWPGSATIADLDLPYRRRLPGQRLAERSLAALQTEHCELDACFGRDPAGRHDALAGQLFARWRAPLLRARFEQTQGRWQLAGLRLLGIKELSTGQCRFAAAAAGRYLGSPERPGAGGHGFHLAILHHPEGVDLPSDSEALRKFAAAAIGLGLHPEFITPGDLDRLPEFDALFIRDTTFAHHYTYAFARCARDEGLVVIDDPDSIRRCNNKVYLAELLARHRLPVPRTLLVHRDNIDRVLPELGLPCVLKEPDSSFSAGVCKIDSAAALHAALPGMLEKSALIVAQEWLPTEFDWRVGILDRRVLFVCKYHMAPGHWQIIDRRHGHRAGRTEALAVAEAPPAVLRLALQAANLIGDGFYGVDIKETGGRCCVIEINDNPNVDTGQEDGVLQDALYREVMAVFRRRLEQRHAAGETA